MILNKKTSYAVDSFIKDPSHALLLSGVKGMGKKFLAQSVAMKILNTDKPKDPRIYINQSTDNGINDVREFVKSIHLKAYGSNFNQVMIFNDADQLTVEAQTALLKLVEEPPKGTIIIFTSANDQLLLPTIHSRVQKIDVKRLSDIQISKLLGTDLSDKTVKLSGGRPGFAFSLQENGLEEVESSIGAAKSWVKSSVDNRVIILSNIKKKEELTQLLNGLLIISSAALKQNMTTNSSKSAKQWMKITKAANTAMNDMGSSINLKILSLKFMADASL